MLTDQSKGIREFIFDRLFKIDENILPKDGEYQELVEASAALLTELFEAAGPEIRSQVDAYDCGWAQRMNRQDELVYGQGLIDGVMLATWIDRVRRGGESLSELVDGRKRDG